MKVLKIGAIWCNTCNVMRPRWKELEAQNPELKTEYYEYDDNPELMQKLKISEELVPVFIFMGNDGKELDRVAGEVDKDKLQSLIDKYISK
ncbi:thioredoxin family protein [Candidatus Dojkabacteria bacterium]|uniref:Thioredoxin family protein n=1 Tax=Candidatus Dojkabacteria bacterium TaxID=2099670 RepID=A0A955RLL3_9BACT|nr:thioredoxin family protein [Candidatus Dojkabacteria bacterium]